MNTSDKEKVHSIPLNYAKENTLNDRLLPKGEKSMNGFYGFFVSICTAFIVGAIVRFIISLF